MRRRIRTLLLVPLAAICSAGCVHTRPAPLPHPTVSPAQSPSQPTGFKAGFGRADITPPPGLGIQGYGPEGREIRGWRQRLHARALVLEDADGERLALVAIDLPQTSILLHRSVAAQIRSTTRIGADRLLMAATHTHAGPGHYFAYHGINHYGSSVTGFDRATLDFLTRRISNAVLAAHGSLRPARAAWGSTAVWFATRNRSLSAFNDNPGWLKDRFPEPSSLFDEFPGHVDSTFAMLRVDLEDPGSGSYVPAGALSIFAIHGTGNASLNNLVDADVHGFVERRVERHIDSLAGRELSFEPTASHLFMNGAEGDVAPDMETPCQVPGLQQIRRPGGPRTPPRPQLWVPPDTAHQVGCVAQERARVEEIGEALSAAAIQLYDDLGSRLSGDFTVRRAFRTASMADSHQLAGLCEPRVGTASVGGSNDRPTRFRSWHPLGFITIGFDTTSSRLSRPTGCHGIKRRLFGVYQQYALRALPMPEVAQLAVYRIGRGVVGAVPFEPTTVAGAMMRDAIADGAPPMTAEEPLILLVGLANGYNQYVASPWEYDHQLYEGGFTIYGKHTASRLAESLGDLSRRLPRGDGPSPAAEVPRVWTKTGRDHKLFPPATAGPPPERIERELTASWQGDTLVARWNDVRPGRLIPADGPVLRIDELTSGAWVRRAWDDDPRVEVRALKRAGRRGQWWEARWSPPTPPSDPVRVVLLARGALPEVAGPTVTRP